MKKRSDEKHNILNKLARYEIPMNFLESVYFKIIHKRPVIIVWTRENSKEHFSIKRDHEVRTEKDI